MKASPGRFACGVGGVVIAVIGMSLAWWVGTGFRTRESGVAAMLPKILHADSSSGGASISLASARVTQEYEGLFILDHKSGNLFCVLLNPRTGQEVATFSANVFVGLNLNNVAGLDLVMTTAFVDLTEGGRAGIARPATCVCYVADGNSGRAAGYGFLFNPQAVLQNVGQNGQLQLMWQGAVRAQGFGIPNGAAPAAGGLPGQNANDAGGNNNNNN